MADVGAVVVEPSARTFEDAIVAMIQALFHYVEEGDYAAANTIWDMMQTRNQRPSVKSLTAYSNGLQLRKVPEDDVRLAATKEIIAKIQKKNNWIRGVQTGMAKEGDQEQEHVDDIHVAADRDETTMQDHVVVEHDTEDQSSEHVAEDQSSEHIAEDQSSEHVAEDQSSEHIAEDQSSEHIAEDQSSEHVAEDEHVAAIGESRMPLSGYNGYFMDLSVQASNLPAKTMYQKELPSSDGYLESCCGACSWVHHDFEAIRDCFCHVFGVGKYSCGCWTSARSLECDHWIWTGGWCTLASHAGVDKGINADGN